MQSQNRQQLKYPEYVLHKVVLRMSTRRKPVVGKKGNAFNREDIASYSSSLLTEICNQQFSLWCGMLRGSRGHCSDQGYRQNSLLNSAVLQKMPSSVTDRQWWTTVHDKHQFNHQSRFCKRYMACYRQKASWSHQEYTQFPQQDVAGLHPNQIPSLSSTGALTFDCWIVIS